MPFAKKSSRLWPPELPFLPCPVSSPSLLHCGSGLRRLADFSISLAPSSHRMKLGWLGSLAIVKAAGLGPREKTGNHSHGLYPLVGPCLLAFNAPLGPSFHLDVPHKQPEPHNVMGFPLPTFFSHSRSLASWTNLGQDTGHYLGKAKRSPTGAQEGPPLINLKF